MNILIPDSWLREYLETNANPKQIKDCLSLCGPSIERLNTVKSDVVYDIEITTNRIDMASVYGIAREAAAILPRFGFKAKLKELKVKDPKIPDQIIPMEIFDPKNICNRIMGIVMNVEPMTESPKLMKDRIEKSGVRSLNNLVDITNYVMLEVGHPCHVFDYDRIKTHKFLLRKALKDESIITLDGKKYSLNTEDVIIDDGTGRVIDLPGIMGTENSVVTKNTRRIFFFIESNNPVLIRKTSMRYGIRTMAATINEKHPDPELVKTAMLRGIELYQQLAGGKTAGKLIDIYPNKSKPVTIKTTVEFINKRLGIELKKEEIITILDSLGFNHQSSTINHQLLVTPPTFRQFDCTIPEDIVEEVARIYGYHNLPAKLMYGEIPISDKPKILELEGQIKQMLKFWGYTEIYNYSFTSKETIEKANLKTSDHIRVANPLTSEIEYMRVSLVPTILENISKNQLYSDNLQLFEIAKIYVPKKDNLPFEIPVLVISNQNNFFKLKGIAGGILQEIGIMGAEEFIPEKDQDFAGTWKHFWHPGQIIALKTEGKILGYIGKVSPLILQNYQIKNGTYLAVLNLQILSELNIPLKQFIPISPYPPVIEDLTISFEKKIKIGEIILEIKNISPIISKVEIFDQYAKYITLRITYSSQNILNTEDVKAVREKILQTLKKKFNASLKISSHQFI